MERVVEQLGVPEQVLSSPGDHRQHPAPERRDHPYADLGGPKPQDARTPTVVDVDTTWGWSLSW
jgi:hypothetical protein